MMKRIKFDVVLVLSFSVDRLNALAIPLDSELGLADSTRFDTTYHRADV